MAVTGGFEATSSANTSSSVATFTNFDIGTAAADRLVVVAITTEENATITGCTIGGNSATQLINQTNTASNPDLNAAIFALPVASGGTATITVTLSANDAAVGISVYALYGAESTPTDSDFATNNGTSISLSTVTIPTDGFGIFLSITGAHLQATTWTNATENSDANAGGEHRHSAASTSTAGTPTVTSDGNNGDNLIVGVAFGPAATQVNAPRAIYHYRMRRAA